jgi:bacterioferritin-associated ferredoxin
MFICSMCGVVREGREQCDVRIEFRRLLNFERNKVIGVGYSCTTCAERISGLLRDEGARLAVFHAIVATASEREERLRKQGSLL